MNPFTTTPSESQISDARSERPSRRVHAGGLSSWASRLAPFGAAFSAYLVVATALWWGAWSTHPTSVTTCGCGDPALFLWFLGWPAYAISHGHNVLYSTALFHPGGINLLSNTSVLAIGIPLAPVTWLLGPVATLNVASTLGPAVSALAMFWLVRRWLRWTPAAFIGGLLFGFSPYVVYNLADAHLMTAVLVTLPLMVGCLDELLVRQRHRPAVVGAVLGLLVTVQFFLSTEVLAIAAIAGVVGVVLLAGNALLRALRGLTDRLRHALCGLGVAAGSSVALLAYPLWFALAGPAHLSGLVWPDLAIGVETLTPGQLVSPSHLSAVDHQHRLILGGYQGSSLPGEGYLGLGLVILLVAALVVWRRDRRLWFFGAIGVVAVTLSFGERAHYWLPWRLFLHAPLVENILPARFMTVTIFCVAVMLAIVVDRVHGSVLAWVRGIAARRVAQRRAALTGALAAALAGVAVAAAALVPVAQEVAISSPLTTQPVIVPRWFVDAAPHLRPGQVVLAYPAPFSGVQSAQAWQAVDRMHFALIGGGGPQGLPSRAGKERAGQVVLSDASTGFHGIPAATAANVDAVRQALAGWGVTLIVVPAPAGRPRYDQGVSTSSAVGLLTAVVGRSPQFTDDAWVWANVASLGRPLPVSTEAFGRCTSDEVWKGAPQAVPDCILAAAGSTA